MAWILSHFRLLTAVFGSAIFAVLGFSWNFILMAYKTEARVGDMEKMHHAQQVQISTIDRQTAELIGIMKSVKEDTTTLKGALIKDALNKKTR